MCGRGGLSSSINPDISPNVNPGINPRVNPNINPGISPNINPSISPNVDPDIKLGVKAQQEGQVRTGIWETKTAEVRYGRCKILYRIVNL